RFPSDYLGLSCYAADSRVDYSGPFFCGGYALVSTRDWKGFIDKSGTHVLAAMPDSQYGAFRDRMVEFHRETLAKNDEPQFDAVYGYVKADGSMVFSRKFAIKFPREMLPTLKEALKEFENLKYE